MQTINIVDFLKTDKGHYVNFHNGIVFYSDQGGKVDPTCALRVRIGGGMSTPNASYTRVPE